MDGSYGSYFGDGTRRTSAAASLLPSLSNSPTRSTGDEDHEFTTEELLEQIVNPYIEDDSPAAAALRANAEIHIGKMSKVARSINAQALRKFVKRASMRSHFGKVKGKPPRVPPSMQRQGDMDESYKEQHRANIFGITEEEAGDFSESEQQEESVEEISQDNKSQMSESERTSLSKESKSTIGTASPTSPQQRQKTSMIGMPSSQGGVPISPKKSPNRVDFQFKEAPPNIREHPGDHLRISLQEIEKEGSLRNLVADVPLQEKDIPPELVEGTMEAGRKGKLIDILIR